MDPLFAVAALVIALVALELGHMAGLARGRRERGADPFVIRAMPLTFKAPPAPYQSSTGEAIG